MDWPVCSSLPDCSSSMRLMSILPRLVLVYIFFFVRVIQIVCLNFHRGLHSPSFVIYLAELVYCYLQYWKLLWSFEIIVLTVYGLSNIFALLPSLPFSRERKIVHVYRLTKNLNFIFCYLFKPGVNFICRICQEALSRYNTVP